MRPYLGLVVGVVAVSFAAILIRLAHAPALVIATYRLTLASFLVFPLAWWQSRGTEVNLRRRDLLLSVLAGIALALHFAFWISSLSYTSVASSVVLVTISPLIVGVASHFFTDDKLSKETLLGIGVAMAGAVVIGYGGLHLGLRELFGDVLAILGSVAVAAYFMLGRNLRARLSLLSYTSIAYTAAAIVLLILSLLARQNLYGYSKETYLMLVLLALGPQLLGHSYLNWTLRYVSATFVAVAVLGEPVGATLLAYVILGERPTLAEICGGALILLGIYIALSWGRLQLHTINHVQD
jgi:drug/metabolite transporter (DMT)-like permease